MDSPFVSVIVLNFNGKQFLKRCLSSVLEGSYRHFELLLVDNGSTDGSVQFVREKFPAVRVIELKENLGFSGGNNVGVAHAAGSHIALLNNDTVVEERWLEELVSTIAPLNVAVASSFVKTEGVRDAYYEMNGSINFLGHNIMRVFSRPEDIFYAGGASLMYKRDVLGEPFDPDYFAYGEDVYLSLRARFVGYDIRHANGSRVLHVGNATARRMRPSFVSYLQERNRLLNIILFFSGETIAKCLPYLIANFFGKLLMGLFGRRYSFVGIMRAYIYFITHWRGIVGKRLRIREERRVSEDEVVRLMTSRLTNGESPAGRLANKVSLWYCRLANLRTIEFTHT